MTRNVALLSALALSVFLLAAGPAASRSRVVTDGILRVLLSSGWTGAVAPGIQENRSVAWITVADYRLPANAAKMEGGLIPPPHKLVIGIGDFITTSWSRRFPSVTRVHIPHKLRSVPLFFHVRRGARFLWHARFKGRELYLDVKFGSKRDAATTALTNRVLGSLRRQP